jgi:hypothetical protein
VEIHQGCAWSLDLRVTPSQSLQKRGLGTSYSKVGGGLLDPTTMEGTSAGEEGKCHGLGATSNLPFAFIEALCPFDGYPSAEWLCFIPNFDPLPIPPSKPIACGASPKNLYDALEFRCISLARIAQEVLLYTCASFWV